MKSTVHENKVLWKLFGSKRN